MGDTIKSTGKGQNVAKNRKSKEKKKAKGGKGKEHRVKGGKVGKSPKNGCHRYKGPHYVSECPKSPEMTVD